MTNSAKGPRILEVRERSVPISRYSDGALPSGGLTTSIVAIKVGLPGGRSTIGYGFSSVGRYAQSGLIRERFAPRLLDAPSSEVCTADGLGVDPMRAWKVMMHGEKPGGHGERCVAVGTLDMALWDAAAKTRGVPLYVLLGGREGHDSAQRPTVEAYASGGYPYPTGDLARLSDEVRAMVGAGYTSLKIKVGAHPLSRELQRIETVLGAIPESVRLAVDAMSAYEGDDAVLAAKALAPYALWWFEDVCDPLDFETLRAVVASYPPPVAAGEALFSADEAVLLDRHGGLRHNHDRLVFDPAHCYGIPGFLRVVTLLERRGWQRSAFWAHGGHLFSLHVAAGLRLGGTEMNPRSFAPFGGLDDGQTPALGRVSPPDQPGIGFEGKRALIGLFHTLL